MRRIFILCFILGMGSCSQKKINKSNMIGKYKVHLELDEKTFDKQGVKDSITMAISRAKDELSKMNIRFDNTIDTNTTEGKMEYIAQSFAKTMGNFGKDLSELGILMGEAAGDVAVKAMEMTENLVQHIKMDVELQENGKIQTSSSTINNVQFEGTQWEVKENMFVFKDETGKTKKEFKISDHTNEGFVLLHDKYRLVFERILN